MPADVNVPVSTAARAIRYTPPSQAEVVLGGGVVYAMILALIFLQKFAAPIGVKLPISVPLIAVYIGLAAMVMRLQIKVAPTRLAAFALLFTGIFISQMFSLGGISTLSLLQLLVLYFPLVFIWRVSQEQYLKTLNVFQNAMLVICAVVAIQLLSQALFGLGVQPSIEDHVPVKFLLPGYNYDAPIKWGAKFVRPNGFFFLEPSFASSFLACALITELMFFHRLWRTAVYAAALLGCVAATGLVLFALALPFVIRRQSARMILAGAGLAMVAGLVGFATGTFDGLIARVGELGSPGSSAWQRLVAPVIQLGQVYSDPRYVLTGAGAGSNLEGNSSTWPVVKVMIEYGVLSGLAFMLLLVNCAINAPNRAVAFAFFVIFNFTGGFLMTPASVIQFWLLIALMAPVLPPRPVSWRPRRRRDVAAPAA